MTFPSDPGRRGLLAAAGLAATSAGAPAATPRHHLVPVRPLTAAAFAPHGQVLAPDGRPRLPINTYGDRLDLYREGFESDQPIEWFIVEGRPRAPRALFLERHMLLTQTFIPLGGAPFVMLVAPPGAREETPGGFPAPDEVEAFLVPGNTAVQIHRGTWHENPFPLRDGQRLLVTSHAALTRAHQGGPAAAALASLPLDLERRFTAQAGVELVFDLRFD